MCSHVNEYIYVELSICKSLFYSKCEQGTYHVIEIHTQLFHLTQILLHILPKLYPRKDTLQIGAFCA